MLLRNKNPAQGLAINFLSRHFPSLSDQSTAQVLSNELFFEKKNIARSFTHLTFEIQLAQTFAENVIYFCLRIQFLSIHGSIMPNKFRIYLRAEG